MQIVIANLGTGNLRSVKNAVVRAAGNDAAARISAEPDAILQSTHLILPGQGAMGAWVSQLKRAPLLKRAVLARLETGPVLGICLGLQALCKHSEENGGVKGLSLFDAEVRRFTSPPGARFKVPHIGWNRVSQVRSHALWRGINDGERFYFVHSYHVQCAPGGDAEVGRADYACGFAAACARRNVFAVQFHPEKSHAAGLRLLQNFLNWNGED